MKTRKFLWALLPVAAALMMTSCSSEDDSTAVAPKPSADTAVKTIPYTVTVGQDATTTRATVGNDDVTLKFAAGDKLYVQNTAGDIYGCLSLQSGAGSASATFSGDLSYTGDEPADNTALNATLVGANDELATVDGDKVTGFSTIPVGNISATLAEAVQKYSVLQGTGTYGEKNFTLSQQTAFMKFSIALEDGTVGGETVPVVIKNGSETLRSFDITTTGTTRFIDIKADFVLAMPAGTVIAAKSTMCIANVGTDDESITYSPSSATTLAAGKVYDINKPKDFVRLAAGTVVFSSRNLGATSVTGFGDHYMWGHTTPVYGNIEAVEGDRGFNANYRFWVSGRYWPETAPGAGDSYYDVKFSKYVLANQPNRWGLEGDPDNKLVLDPEDDAATVNLGEPWRIPTFSDMSSIFSSPVKIKTPVQTGVTINGVPGRLWEGKGSYEGKAVFLPSAYSIQWDGNYGVPKDGHADLGDYWLSTLTTSISENANTIYFFSDEATPVHVGGFNRTFRSSIRPVHN